MKRLLVSVIGSVIVLIAAALFGPLLIDWKSQQPRLAAVVQDVVREATGRELTIAGDIEFALLPSPALTAKSVRLRGDLSDPGRAEGNLSTAELDEIKLAVGLWPLFTGRIEVESLVLVRPKLVLGVGSDGTVNWDLLLASAGGQGAGETWLSGRLQLDRYAIQDGTLAYRTSGGGFERRVEEVDAVVAVDEASGSFRIEGTASLQGLKSAFQANLGRFDKAGSAVLEAALDLPSARTGGGFTGTVTRQGGRVSLAGSVTGMGSDLAGLIAALGGSDAPAALANSFSVAAEVSPVSDGLALSGIELLLGEAALDGAGTLRWAAGLSLEARLSAGKLDLDQLLSEAASASGESLPQALASLYPALRSGLGADIDLRVDDLIYRGQSVRRLHMIGQLEPGLATLHKASALLPGGTEISLSGSLADGLLGPSFLGHLTTSSNSLRATLEWGGMDLSGVPNGRLDGVDLSAEIAAKRGRLDLQDLDVSLDGSRAQGAIVVALRERPALGIGLLIDRLDLSADLAGPDRSERLWSGLRDLLRAFDANLDLRVGTFVHPDLTVENLQLVARLQGDGLAIEELSGTDADGNFARYAGELSAFGGAFALAGALELGVAAPAPLARLLELDPEAFEAIAPFDLEGKLRVDADALQFKGEVAALGGHFELDGTLPSLTAPMEFALSLDARHEDLAELIGNLPGFPTIGPSLGSLAANARLTGAPGRLEISRLSGTLGPARVEGELIVDLSAARPSLSAIDLAMAVKHGNAARLLEALTWSTPLTPAFGAVDVAGRVTGSEEGLSVAGLAGRVGPFALKGGLSARLDGTAGSGRVPRLTALDLDVEVRHPSLSTLLESVSLETALTPAFGAVAVAGRVTGTPAELRISDLTGRVGPVEMTGGLAADLAGPALGLRDVDLELAVEHPNLAELATALGQTAGIDAGFGGVSIRGLVAGDSERIEVSELKGTVGPGLLHGGITAELSGARPKISLDLTTGPLPVAVLLGAFSDPDSGDADAPEPVLAGGRWSDAVLDLAGLRRFDADLRMKSSAWLYKTYRMSDAVLRARLRNGVLDLRKLTGRIYGGEIQVVGKLKSGSPLNVGLTVDAVDLEIAQLLRPHTSFDRVTGPVTVKASLVSEGESEAELISGLNGRGTLTGSLNFKARPQEAASATLLALLGGQSAGATRNGSIDAGQTLINAFAGEPAGLDGNFAVTRGVIETDNTRLDASNAYAVTRGGADLAAWRVDSRVDVYRRDNLEESYLTVDLDGPLDGPGSSFHSQRADALLGSGQGSLVERVREFRGMLDEVVDFEPMARYVLGRHTETITPAQWSRFLKQYETLFLQGYEFSAGSTWTGEWNVQDIRPYGEDLLITVAFEDRSGGSSKVGFRVREKANALFGFKIVDAISQGISLLVTQKSEFSSILKRQGVDGLTRVLEREFSDSGPETAPPGVQNREAFRTVPHRANR